MQDAITVGGMTSSPHSWHHDHNETWLLEILELDATLLGSYLADATAWLRRQVASEPQLIVDVGTGLGGGSFALAEQFPTANVAALDRSQLMLDRVRSAAIERGLSERVTPVSVDVDLTWPGLANLDLVWASSSLHEVARPARVFADIHAALKPGGLLAVLELDSLPSFLPADVGLGKPGLESRVHAVLTDLGWNKQLVWEELIEQSGFELVERRGFVSAGQQDAAVARHYAETYLQRIRPTVQEHLAADDLVTLDALLAGTDPSALLQTADLSAKVSRTAWLARRR